MNIRNEADNALDEAFKDHLKNLMMTCFTRITAHNDGTACDALLEGLKKANAAYSMANKALDQL